MRAIAERLLFGEAASTELWVFDGVCEVAICIDEINRARNADGSALGIDEDLCVLAHAYGLIEIIAKCLRTRWVAQL